MDQERVTRTTLPQVTVGMPLSLLKWVDEQAREAGLSRSGWIVKIIERERVLAPESPDSEAQLAAAS